MAIPSPQPKPLELGHDDNTPLMRRLRSILATPLDSAESQEALEALSECMSMDINQHRFTSADNQKTDNNSSSNNGGSTKTPS